MSVANYLEAIMIIEGRVGDAGGREIDNYLVEAGVELVSVTQEQAQAVRLAWRRYGRGNHPAGLNFGDCFAYALAEVSGEPLLFAADTSLRTNGRFIDCDNQATYEIFMQLFATHSFRFGQLREWLEQQVKPLAR